MADDRVSLAGSERVPLAGATAVGPVDPAERFTVTVYVRANPAAGDLPSVDELSAALPADRHYLSPDEAAARFGADPADLEKVAAFARDHGLEVVDRSVASRSVRLSGTAARFGKAFGVDLQRFEHAEGEYRGRTGDVTVPASLAGVVDAVLGLDNRRIGRAYLRPGIGPVLPMPGDGDAAPAPAAEGAARSAAKPSAAPQLPPNTYFPPTVAGLYGFPGGVDGSGECVAVLAFNGQVMNTGVSATGGYDAQVLSAYFQRVLGQAVPSIVDVVVHGPGNTPGDGSGDDTSGEVMLDLCVVGSVAPGARIAVYFTEFTEQGWVDAIHAAVADTANDPSVVSISYGNPEDDSRQGLWTAMAVKQVNLAFQAAAAQGRSICCASGDDGSADEPATTAVHADFPASSPFVLACGGTRLEASGTRITSETVWNDLARQHGATGGGVSRLFPVPAWQAKAKVPPCADGSGHTGRGVPDVAALADPETPFVVAGNDARLVPVGGTSASAPLWAALLARLNQGLGAKVGFLNPVLYTRLSPGVTRDVVTGDNGAYRAGVGWDPCTGWGSPDGAKLLTGLSGGAPAKTPH